MAKATGRSTATMAEQQHSYRFSRAVSLLCFFLSGLLIVTYHLHAEDANDEADGGTGDEDEGTTASTNNSGSAKETTTTLWRRIQRGPEALERLDLILFTVLMLLAFELLDFVAKHSGQWLGSKQIPVRGKHLDDLTPRDLLFIGISKAATAPFVYCYLRYAYHEPRIVWSLRNVTFSNTLVPLIALFVIYDFFYTLLHWFLHLKVVYAAVHKHHHHQKAPSRANVDAVNVHPLEFALGEYNHLFALFLYCRFFCSVGIGGFALVPSNANVNVHVVAAILFLAVGGVLAGINHTRYDVVVNLPFWPSFLGGKGKTMMVYDSKAHDVHHRFPQSNYGQYTMLWDVVLGSYRPYDPNDGVNPSAQLDPKTGKSFAHAAAAAAAAAASAGGSVSGSSGSSSQKISSKDHQQ